MSSGNSGSGTKTPNPDLEARIRQLEAERDAAVQRADAADARANVLEADGDNRRYTGDKPVESATRKKPVWPFAVKVTAMPKGHPAVADRKIQAVDESEAIRQFCLMSKDEKGRQLDPTRYQFHAECTDPKREAHLLEKQRHRRAVALGHEDPRPRGKEHDRTIDTRINPATRQPVGGAA